MAGTTKQDRVREDVDPSDIPGTGRIAILKRTVKEFQEDNITDWAAALTYYSVLALFPALLALVAIVGLVGQYPQTTNTILDILRGAGAGDSLVDSVGDTINGIVQNKGGAGALLGFGLLAALWSASGYIGAFMRASNAIYDIDEGRPIWKTLPLRVGLTVLLMVLTAVSAVGVTLSGGLAQEVGKVIGVGDTAVDIWNIA
jgi:membrane protein